MPEAKRGAGGKGLGQARNLRHRKIIRDNIKDTLSKPAIRRLARRGGVKRIKGTVYESTRGKFSDFLKDNLATTIEVTKHAKRKTVSVNDALYGLKFNNIKLYK